MNEDTKPNNESPEEEKKLPFSPLVAGGVFLLVVIILAALVYTWQRWEEKKSAERMVNPTTEELMQSKSPATELPKAEETSSSYQENSNSSGLIMPQNYNTNEDVVPGNNVGPANIPTVAPPGAENVPKGTKEMQYPVPPGVENIPTPSTTNLPTPPAPGSAADDEAANYAKQFTAPPTPPNVNAVNMNINSSYPPPPVAPPTSITNTNTNKKR